MESGTIIGICASVIVITSASAVLLCYSRGQSTLGRTLKYVAIEAGVILGGLMLTLLLLDIFRAIDSSHGVMAFGIPVIVSIIMFFFTVIVIFSTAAASYKQRQ